MSMALTVGVDLPEEKLDALIESSRCWLKADQQYMHFWDRKNEESRVMRDLLADIDLAPGCREIGILTGNHVLVIEMDATKSVHAVRVVPILSSEEG